MAKNRKDDSALRLAPALTAVVLCSFFVVLGVGFVWYKDQIDLLGHQIKEREVRLADLQRNNNIKSDQLATLCTAKKLNEGISRFKLNLAPPAFSQVIRLVEMPEGATPPDSRQAAVAVRNGKTDLAAACVVRKEDPNGAGGWLTLK